MREVKNYQTVTIIPARNGVIVEVGRREPHCMPAIEDTRVFNNDDDLFEFIADHLYTDSDNDR